MHPKQLTLLLLSYISVLTTQGQTTYLKEHNTVQSPSIKPILVENVRIIDGKGVIPIDKGFVLVRDGRIEQVQEGIAPSSIKTGVEVVNGTGKSVMPGLIDAHIHSVNDQEFLELLLTRGTTSFRDPGHPFTFYQAIHFAKRPVPRVFLTGAHLDYPPVAYGQQATLVRSKEHVQQIVDSHYKNGATAIKLYFRLPLEFYQGAISTAKTYGIPVVAHLELVRATDAIKAGVMGIEHVTSFGTSIADEKVTQDFLEKVDAQNNARRVERYRLWATLDMDSPKLASVIDYAVANNVYLCPTLAAFEKQVGGNVQEYEVKGFENMIKFVTKAHKSGMKIVVGSHTASDYSEHGWTYQREMELLQKAGLSPLEIIHSSTALNAIYLGNQSRLGSIEKGKAADLLLINGNPSKDLNAMYKIDAVLLNGAWVTK